MPCDRADEEKQDADLDMGLEQEQEVMAYIIPAHVRLCLACTSSTNPAVFSLFHTSPSFAISQRSRGPHSPEKILTAYIKVIIANLEEWLNVLLLPNIYIFTIALIGIYERLNSDFKT